MVGERFRLFEDRLRAALEDEGGDLGFISTSTDPDELAATLQRAEKAGIIEAPPGLEILVYPDSVAEGDVALITVFSLRRPYAHVAASSALIYKLSGESDEERTIEAFRTIVDTASNVVPAVRLLEHQGWPGGSDVYRHAGCPRCGQVDQLRVEYRYDVLGLDAEGELIPGDPERTDLFCLACGNEVDRAVPIEGPSSRHDGEGSG